MEHGFQVSVQDKFAYLNITPVRKRLVERSIQCALSCLDTLPCFSFNLAALQDNNDKLLCEHLPSDKYNNSDQFVVSKVFHHFSILVSSENFRQIRYDNFISFEMTKFFKSTILSRNRIAVCLKGLCRWVAVHALWNFFSPFSVPLWFVVSFYD